MHARRASATALWSRLTPLFADVRRVRCLLSVLAALMFSVHLFGIHVGHGEEAALLPANGSGQPYATHATNPETATVNEVLDPSDAGPQVDSTHDAPACGEAVPSRGCLPAEAICPSLQIVWELEPLARTYVSPRQPGRPHRARSLVHELGVQRV